jgi:hypothetical protein
MGILARITSLRNRLEANGVSLFHDVNAAVDVNLGGRHMPDETLTPEELERQRAEPLPDREAMSTINPAIATMPPVPVDAEDPLFPTDPLPHK